MEVSLSELKAQAYDILRHMEHLKEQLRSVSLEINRLENAKKDA